LSRLSSVFGNTPFNHSSFALFDFDIVFFNTQLLHANSHASMALWRDAKWLQSALEVATRLRQ